MSATAPSPGESDPDDQGDADTASTDLEHIDLDAVDADQGDAEPIEGELYERRPPPAGGEVTRTFVQAHSGPLPPAAELARYEDVQPGLAERIIAMAEREQNHRHSVENTDTREPYRLAARGQALAMVTIVLFLLFGGGLVWAGQPEIGAILVALDLAAIVYTFVVGQRRDDSPPPDNP